MESRLLMTLQVAVASIQKIGAVPHGTRAVAQVAGGHFEGPRFARQGVAPVAAIGRCSAETVSSNSTCASHSRPMTALSST